MQIGDIVKSRLASIESNAGNTSSTSIELPEEISSLIVGEAFRQARINRYRMLIRQGHLQRLLELAKYCRRVATKNPAYLFAKMAGKAQWERTLTFVDKLLEVAKTAAQVIARLAPRPEQLKAVYKAVWRFGQTTIPKAVLAQEIVGEKGGNTARLFNYLCWKT